MNQDYAKGVPALGLRYLPVELGGRIFEAADDVADFDEVSFYRVVQQDVFPVIGKGFAGGSSY